MNLQVGYVSFATGYCFLFQRLFSQVSRRGFRVNSADLGPKVTAYLEGRKDSMPKALKPSGLGFRGLGFRSLGFRGFGF